VWNTVSAWRYQLKLPRAYIVAALKKPESVATIRDVERVLPHILRGTGAAVIPPPQ
jgi:hypothetical protein